jgi:hypothetical protein
MHTHSGSVNTTATLETNQASMKKNSRGVARIQARAKRKVRSEKLRDIFDRCANTLDKSDQSSWTKLDRLAGEIGAHRVTLWKWTEVGSVPKRKAAVLHRRFGAKVDFTVADLTG